MTTQVTRAYLPDLADYTRELESIWASGWITNHGALLQRLESRLRQHCDTPHLELVSSGTLALQFAIEALGLQGEIITTPFSYVATTSSISWQGCTPVFADIDPATLTIDPDQVASLITPATSAILATHIFGLPCAVEAIDQIARRHGLKVIYDAAHAFGVSYQGRSLLTYGDVATLSLHATKLMHTAEGGAVITNDPAVAASVERLRNFGHDGQEAIHGMGINGKLSELHAAIGLGVLPKVDQLIEKRRVASVRYDGHLFGGDLPLTRPSMPSDTVYNYAYYPVLLPDEASLLKVRAGLQAVDIFPRRYFYPSLNRLDFVPNRSCPVSENVSSRVLCLPLHHDLPASKVDQIALIIRQTLLAGQAVHST